MQGEDSSVFATSGFVERLYGPQNYVATSPLQEVEAVLLQEAEHVFA
jgi:hypothetical protein